jgi:hypothetical protein
MNPMPEYQPIEPLEPMNNNPSGKSRLKADSGNAAAPNGTGITLNVIDEAGCPPLFGRWCVGGESGRCPPKWQMRSESVMVL